MSERTDPADPGAKHTPRPNEGSLLDRAGEIFLEVRELDPLAREEVVERKCAGFIELKNLVQLLLSGDQEPLTVERLAEDIRAAREVDWTHVLPGGSPEASAALLANDRIGNYRVLERLGEGGFGVVFHAEQERPIRRRVALKIIKLGMDTRQVVARFEAERQALAMMDHPNIAKVFDAGATETGRPYFVMELVRGSPITEYCDRKKLTIRQRLELMSQVCDALQHAHQKGVIHRDIKPSNVLVEGIEGSRDQGIEKRKSSLDPSMPRSLDPFRAKIIDFGIAKATSARLTEKTIFTEFRQMIGTPEYMSPEQAGESNEDVDTRTDVYSAGVLLYELLTGSTPFDSQRLRSAAFGEMQRIIREEEPPRPSTKLTNKKESLDTVAAARDVPPAKLTSAIRGELDWIVMKALEKDRARRYDSAGSMARDLHRYLAGEAVHAAPPSRSYAARKFLQRHRGPVLAALLFSATLIAGLVGTSIGFFRADERRRDAVKQRDRADASTAEAMAQKRQAEWQAYLANIGAAMTALRTGEWVAARVRLDACSPGLRDWEWRYATSQLDTSVRSFDGVRFPHLNGLDVDVAPDGRTIVTPYHEPDTGRWGAQISDAKTGQGRVILLGGHTERVQTARFSPDGTRIVTASVDGSARLYDTRDGHEVAVLHTGDTEVVMASFDPAGRRIICCPQHGQPIRVFNAKSLAEIASLADAGPYSAYLVPGCDSALVTGGFNPPMLWDWTITAPQTRSFAPITNYSTISNLATPTRDGKRLAATNQSGIIRLIDRVSGRIEATMRGHRGQVSCMAFNADGSLLASASLDGTVRVWDTTTGDQVQLLLGHTAYVWAVVFSPDGSMLYSAGGDVRVWPVRPHDIAEYMQTASNQGLLSLRYSPDGRYLLTAGGKDGARLYDSRNHQLVRVIDTATTIHIEFSADGGRLITTNGAGCIRVWNTESWALLAESGANPDGISGIAVNRDATRIAVSTWKHEGMLYDGNAGLITALPGFDHWSGAMAFTPDGAEVIVDAHREQLRRWRASDGAALPDLPITASSLHSIEFGPGLMLLSHEAGHATLWEWPAGTLVHELQGHGGPARGAVFLPASQTAADSSAPTAPTRIATIARDGTIRLWDCATGNEVAVIHTRRPFPEQLAVSPDGSEIAVNFEDIDAQFLSSIPLRDRAAGAQGASVHSPAP